MIRLLAILVALHFSSRADGAPNGVGNSREKIIADNKDDWSDLALGGRNAGQKDGLVFEESKALPNGGDKNIETSGTKRRLKPRMLEEAKLIASRSLNWGQKMAQKAKGLGNKTRNKLRASHETEDQEWERWAAYNNPQWASSPQKTTYSLSRTSSDGMSPEDLMDEAIQFKRRNALQVVKDVKDLLSDPNADPTKDKMLASDINTAFYAYHDGFNLPIPKFYGMDKEFQALFQLDVLKPVFDEIDAQEKAYRYSLMHPERASSSERRPSFHIEPLPQYEKSKEASEQIMLQARAALTADPYADPLKDEALGKLIDLVIEQYNEAHERPPFRVHQGMSEDSIMKQKVTELYWIFDDYDKRKERQRKILDIKETVKRMRQPK